MVILRELALKFHPQAGGPNVTDRMGQPLRPVRGSQAYGLYPLGVGVWLNML